MLASPQACLGSHAPGCAFEPPPKEFAKNQRLSNQNIIPNARPLDTVPCADVSSFEFGNGATRNASPPTAGFFSLALNEPHRMAPTRARAGIRYPFLISCNYLHFLLRANIRGFQ